MHVGESVALACRWEVDARKPGNVHPGWSFPDLTREDFVRAGEAISPIMERSSEVPLGETVLECVRATRQVCPSNVNLGIILLLAPLTASARLAGGDLVAMRWETRRRLDRVSVTDARRVYQAIREARPGGLGRVEEQDIDAEPTVTLREAMRLARGRDAVAGQYVSGMDLVFDMADRLSARTISHLNIEERIVWVYLWELSHRTDTLIERKLGMEEAERVRDRARWTLWELIERTDASWPPRPRSGFVESEAVHRLAGYLRDDRHARNPGATADLIAAALFVAVHFGMLNDERGHPPTWNRDSRERS